MGARWDCIPASGEKHDAVVKSMTFQEVGSFAVVNVKMSLSLTHGRYRQDTHYRELVIANMNAEK